MVGKTFQGTSLEEGGEGRWVKHYKGPYWSHLTDSLVIWVKTMSESLEKFIFSVCFWQFFPFLYPRANRSRRCWLICSFLKSDLSDWLPSLFTKEQKWAIRSGRSWQISDREPYAQVAHDKRGKGTMRSFSRANCSFSHKNEWIALKTDERVHNPACNICVTFFLTDTF